VISAALGRGDYEILTASTGFDAGAQVVQDNPQLIILDIHLSDMDGRMVCKRVKERPETKNTRILAISGYIEDDEGAQLPEYGFDGYLKKPFGIAELVAEAERLLALPITKIARPRRPNAPLELQK
jgi:CheY-like chemotaxis protein